MSEFAYLFRGRKTSGSPEGMQKHFEQWAARFKELGTARRLKDPGHPLQSTGKVVSGSQKYAEAKDVVGGYIIVEDDDIVQAVDSRSIEDTMNLVAGQPKITKDQAMAQIAQSNFLKLPATVLDMANAAVLMASDRARMLTGTVINATAGAALD